MRRAILCLLVALPLAPLAGEAAPLPRLSTLAARHQDATVRVLAPDGRVLSSGFFIASVGYAVAALSGARVGEGVVVELSTGARRRGIIARVEPKGPLAIVAVAAASDEELFATLPLGDEGERAKARASGRKGGWLVALCHDDEGRVMPAAGGLRERDARGAWLLDLPCGPGAAVLSGERVVAVTVRARGVTASTGVGVERLFALSRGLSPKRPTALLPSSPEEERGPREAREERTPTAPKGQPPETAAAGAASPSGPARAGR